ncbi:MAG TPA: metallophosphoesterase [Gemmataceae bacterium]|nr:metallophosphoesterase [Gemmataceae bacterium]
MHIAVTADLHFGPRHSDGRDATLALAAELHNDPPDLFLLAGDVGVEDEFARCLELFEDLPCLKALVPGNHDVWVRADDPRGDSLALYREHLPRVSADHGFHYLDAAPLRLPGLTIVGSMNWYDCSWSLERLRDTVPDWEDRLRTKRFGRGRHNDANFVRWDTDDVTFTRAVVATLGEHLRGAEGDVIVVTHHPPFRALNYPKDEPIDADGLLWEAFSGNAACESLLADAERVRFAFCGHTHFAREGTLGRVRGYNVGGDYHFKRLLRLSWPDGGVTATTFGNE